LARQFVCMYGVLRQNNLLLHQFSVISIVLFQLSWMVQHRLTQTTSVMEKCPQMWRFRNMLVHSFGDMNSSFSLARGGAYTDATSSS